MTAATSGSPRTSPKTTPATAGPGTTAGTTPWPSSAARRRCGSTSKRNRKPPNRPTTRNRSGSRRRSPLPRKASCSDGETESPQPDALIPTADYDGLLGEVVVLLETARRTAARAVNAVMTATYWEIGRRIVEVEQRGKSSGGVWRRAHQATGARPDCPLRTWVLLRNLDLNASASTWPTRDSFARQRSATSASGNGWRPGHRANRPPENREIARQCLRNLKPRTPVRAL